MKKLFFAFFKIHLSSIILFSFSFILMNNTTLKASDLITSQIFVPGSTADCNQPFKPQFEICNINIYDAQSYEWSVEVTIRDGSNNVVFSESVGGVFLAKGSAQSPTCVTMETVNSFTPISQGSYTITVDVNYEYDINTENDTKISEFGVTCGGDLGMYPVEIFALCQEQQEGTPITVGNGVRNLGPGDVFWYDWNFVLTIKNSSGNVVYTITIPGVDLASGEGKEMTSPDKFISYTNLESEIFSATYVINYADDIDPSNNRDECSFTVLGDPEPATEPSPIDGETGVSASPGPLLEWNNNGQSTIDEWVINLAPTPLNSDPSLNSVITLTTPTNSYQWPDNLEGNTSYEWRIDLVNEVGRTEGGIWSFTTGGLPVPNPPSTPSPADGELLVIPSPPPLLEWNNGGQTNIDEVLITLAPTPLNSDPSLNTWITATAPLDSYQWQENLNGNSNYEWQVGLKNEFGITYGDIWGFTTTNLPTDLGVKEVSSPRTVEYENTSVTPTFIIKNYGSSDVNGGDWSAEIRTNDGTSTTLFETIPGPNLAAGAEIELKTIASIPLTSSLNVSVELNYPNDTNDANNSETVIVVVFGLPSLPLTPFPADGTLDVPYISPKEFKFTVNYDIPTEEYGFTIAVTPVSGEPSWANVVTATISTPGQLTHIHETDLLPGTEYSWRIDLTNPAGTTEGNVWTFATSSEPTDLGVEDVLRPQSNEFDNVPFTPSFRVKNFGSVQADAADWTAIITISDIYPSTPSIVFQETIQGVDLASGANTDLITSAAYTPYAGTRFLVHVRIDYPNDANNSNNEGGSNFVVHPAPTPPTSPIFPTEGATDIPFDSPLTCAWENPGEIPIDEIKISWLATTAEEPECNLAVPVTATFDGSSVLATWPGELAPDQEYWWRIVQSNPAGETCSEVFSFTTASAWDGVQLLPGEGVEFFQVDFTFPGAEQENSPYGLVVLDFDLIKDATGFSNGFVNVATNNGWVVANMLFDVASGYPGWSTFFDLNTTDNITDLEAFVFVSPDPLSSFEITPTISYDVESRPYNAQGLDRPRGNIPAPIKFEDIPFVEGGRSSVVWQHGHVSIEQDENQCAPASLANSLQWLENKKGITVPDNHNSGIRDNTLVGEIDKTMNRAAHNAVSGKNMIEGKIKYIDENELSDDLVVKHKRRKGTNLISNDTVKVGNTVSIPHSDTTKSLIDWILDELEHGEDVELVILWDGGGGHAVDLIGGGYVEGVPWLAWVHDANQGFDDNGTAGNVADDKVKKNGGLSPDSGGIGWSYIINNKLASVIMGDTGKGTINFALSESRDSTTTSIQDYSNNLKPSEFNLEQNYPNPFNPVATINYQIPVAGFVAIKLYDLNGKEVKVLVNQYKDAGSYKVEFNGNDLASGVYFYRMEVGNINITKKAILLK